MIETLAGRQLPATEAALANSLARAADVTSALRASAGTGSRRSREAEQDNDERGQSAASTLRALRESVGQDEFASRIRPALTATEEALYEWLTAPRPDADPDGPRTGTGRDTTPQVPGRRRQAGLGPPGCGDHRYRTRDAGAPDADVLTPLAEFLRAHHGPAGRGRVAGQE